MPILQTPTGRVYYEVHESEPGPGAEFAPGGGATLLLIMGLGGRAMDWSREFLSPLARAGLRVIAYDHRGCGVSDPEPEPGALTLRMMAEDAAALIEAVSEDGPVAGDGAARVFVAGLSMGGMVAQRLALDHPARVRKLALIGTHCGGPHAVAGDPEVRRQVLNPAPGKLMMRRVIEAMTAPGFAEREPDRLAEHVRRKMENPTRYRSIQAQTRAIGADHRHHDLHRIAAPTLAITGDADRLVPPENSRLLAARIPGARLHVISDCGHLVSLERPTELAAALVGFFAGYE